MIDERLEKYPYNYDIEKYLFVFYNQNDIPRGRVVKLKRKQDCVSTLQKSHQGRSLGKSIFPKKKKEREDQIIEF